MGWAMKPVRVNKIWYENLLEKFDGNTEKNMG
jgi:hypothetical protein